MAGDHFCFSHDLNIRFRDEVVRRNKDVSHVKVKGVSKEFKPTMKPTVHV